MLDPARVFSPVFSPAALQLKDDFPPCSYSAWHSVRVGPQLRGEPAWSGEGAAQNGNGVHSAETGALGA